MRTAEAERLSKEWGRRVRDRRLALSATQQEVAWSLGRDQSWVSRYERGEATFSVDVMLAFASTLGELPEVLFPWSPDIRRSLPLGELAELVGHDAVLAERH